MGTLCRHPSPNGHANRLIRIESTSSLGLGLAYAPTAQAAPVCGSVSEDVLKLGVVQACAEYSSSNGWVVEFKDQANVVATFFLETSSSGEWDYELLADHDAIDVDGDSNTTEAVDLTMSFDNGDVRTSGGTWDAELLDWAVYWAYTAGGPTTEAPNCVGTFCSCQGAADCVIMALGCGCEDMSCDSEGCIGDNCTDHNECDPD